MTRTVLVVDDSESIREVVSFELEKHGFFVLKACDGKEALDYFDGRNIDLLVTDLHMPQMNGIELIKGLRKKKTYTHLPILFLTTETQKPLMKEAKEAGATGWIIKPFDINKLMKAINKVLR